MSADVESPPLTKVDSAVDDKKTRRQSTKVAGVYSLEELKEQNKEPQLAIETQKLNWKVNTSPTSIDDKDVLKKMLTEPPIKRVDLKTTLGLTMTARNSRGVTIKDAMDAIHKQYKKKDDDELGPAYLAGFEFDKEESWTSFVIHFKATGEPVHSGGGKKKKAAKTEES